jgi:hypothetical protein
MGKHHGDVIGKQQNIAHPGAAASAKLKPGELVKVGQSMRLTDDTDAKVLAACDDTGGQ